MQNELNLYEILLDLAETENDELKQENQILSIENQLLMGYKEFLEQENKDLIKKYNKLFDIKSRKN